jgi:hypothetical protein
VSFRVQATPQSEEASRLTEEFQSVNYLVWDRKASFAENREARRKWRAVWERILCSTAFAGTTHFVFKRSFPFGTGGSRPGLENAPASHYAPASRTQTRGREPINPTPFTMKDGGRKLTHIRAVASVHHHISGVSDRRTSTALPTVSCAMVAFRFWSRAGPTMTLTTGSFDRSGPNNAIWRFFRASRSQVNMYLIGSET